MKTRVWLWEGEIECKLKPMLGCGGGYRELKENMRVRDETDFETERL